MAAGDHQSTRYSTLADITRENVGSLREVWSFSTGLSAGHEAAPLIVGDTMYLVTPFPNVLYALDLSKPGAQPPLTSATGAGVLDRNSAR